jgi:hypothetical protein
MVSLTKSPIDRLRQLVADCPTFQSVVGAADRAAALPYVHVPYVSGDDAVGDMPRAVIDPVGNQWSATRVAEADYSYSGNALLTFEFRIPAAVTAGSADGEAGKDSWEWFDDKVGEILHEMLNLSGTGESFPGETHLNIENIEHADGPIEYPPEESEFDSEDVSQAEHEWFDGFLVTWR